MHILSTSVFRLNVSTTTLQCSLSSELYQKFTGREGKCLVVVVVVMCAVLVL